jgi:phage gp37-like protein
MSDPTKSLTQLAGNQMTMFDTNPGSFDEAQKMNMGALFNQFGGSIDPRRVGHYNKMGGSTLVYGKIILVT